MPGVWILTPREGGPIRLSCCTEYVACHSSPEAGRAVYPTIVQVSFVIGGRHVKVSSPKMEGEPGEALPPWQTMYAGHHDNLVGPYTSNYLSK